MDILQIIAMAITFIIATFTSVKVIVKKVTHAVDEIEDVVILTGETIKESADVLDAFVNAAKPDANGNIVITPEELGNIKVQASEVKQKAAQYPQQIKEAMIALKAVFQKK